MKQAKIVAAVLFLLLIGFGIGEQFYVKKTFRTFDSYAEYFEEKINSADYEAAELTMDEFENWWDKTSTVLESLAHNRDIKTVTQEISQLRGFLTVKSGSDAKVSLITLKAMSKNLEQLLQFRWEHII
ncbi:MAG: DUF4363 family protein [Clostridiales bacterium]|jgi:hypothetical protein|nr:DUF4363 family protein [Clostridiales bacterium]